MFHVPDFHSLPQEVVGDECQYVTLPDGGYEWPLWEWKGSVLRESGCAYGKFLNRKAAFVSKDWWPDFCNYRRWRYPLTDVGSIEAMTLQTLKEHGSLITRELRKTCGFTGTNMRGKFDTILTRLQMGCHIVTEDFIYPHDRHGQQYGWGWSLLTTPERLFGREACHSERAPEESFERMRQHLQPIFPDANADFFHLLLG